MRCPLCEDISNEGLGVLRRLHVVERTEGGRGSSAVQIALQRRKRSSYGAVHVGARRRRDSRRKCRSVERMIGQQNEIGIERVLLDRMGRLARTHVEKVSGLREIGARGDGIETAANPVPGSDDRRHLCDQFDRRVHVGKMFALSVHRRKESETADDRAQDLHRPRRFWNVLHRIDQWLGERAAGAQLAF